MIVDSQSNIEPGSDVLMHQAKASRCNQVPYALPKGWIKWNIRKLFKWTKLRLLRTTVTPTLKLFGSHFRKILV